MDRAQRKLEIQIDKKAKDYRRLKFNHPQDKLKRPLKLNQNSYQSRPFSSQIVRNRSREDRCRLDEELFEDLSINYLKNSKLEEQLKLMNTRASNKND